MCLTHGPLTTTPADPGVTEPRDKFAAMVRYADLCLGRLVDALDELGLRDNTIIVWTTDNGSPGNMSNQRLGRRVRGGKARVTENGVNAPFIVNGPGLVPAGVVTDALTDFTDVLPTFVELADAELPTGYIVDGHSIAPLILGRSEDSPRDWVMALGSKKARRNRDGRIVPLEPYKERVIRGREFKLFIDPERRVSRVVDLRADPWEDGDLRGSDDARVRAARARLEAVIRTLPERDPGPLYTPMSPNPWDVPPGYRPDK
jgi:arylsulfatase A-like enzyme